MNEKLAKDALFALNAKGFETEKGFCARFCRQVCEYSYGDARYNPQWRPDADPSAKDAAIAFKAKGFAVQGPPQLGDILFKTVGSGGFGHVGIFTAKGVAENSSYHWGPSGGTDARGLRSLAQFGAYQVIVRLPPLKVVVVAPKPKAEPLLVWNDNVFPVLFDADERPYIQLAELIKKTGHAVTGTTNRLDQEPPRFYVNSK